MRLAFDYIQKDERRRTVRAQLAARRDRRLGLSAVVHAADRAVEAHDDAGTAEDIIDGAYWMRRPGPNCQVVVAYTGAVAPEAIEAVGLMAEDRRDVGLLAVTSADRLNAGWTAAQPRARARPRACALHIERCSSEVPSHCGLVTVIDGHPGDARLARRRPRPSHALARRRAFRPDRHTLPISIAITASMRMPSSPLPRRSRPAGRSATLRRCRDPPL